MKSIIIADDDPLFPGSHGLMKWFFAQTSGNLECVNEQMGLRGLGTTSKEEKLKELGLFS